MVDKAFIKGLGLLVALAKSREPRALTSLATQLGLTNSNTHRLLTTLIDQGFAMQDGEKGLYGPTTLIWELGTSVIARMDVLSASRRVMARLAEDTRETVHLSILAETEVVYLNKIDGAHAIRAYTEIGGRAPALCVATGKALMAYRSAEAISKASAIMPRATAYTLADPETVAAELARAREEGVAYNRGEWREDVAGVASVIRNANGTVIAAVGISGPRTRLLQGGIERFAEPVKAAGREISSLMGWPGTKAQALEW